MPDTDPLFWIAISATGFNGLLFLYWWNARKDHPTRTLGMTIAGIGVILGILSLLIQGLR